MAKLTIKLNSDGVRELLRSDEVKDFLSQKAGEISGRCGTGYATDTKLMSTRVIASVYTEDPKAMKDNLDNNTLLRAIR